MSWLKPEQSCCVGLVTAAVSAAGRSPGRAPLNQRAQEFPPLLSKDRHWRGARHSPGATYPLLSIRGESGCPPGRIPCPAHARSIPRSPLDHPASCIQNPALACNETAAYRRSLLRLPLIFRYSESIEFPGRTDQCHLRFHEDAAVDGETFAT